MEIKFNRDDWARIRETYDKWWDGTLDRPVLKVTIQKDYNYTGTTPVLTQATCHRLDIPAEEVIERIHADLVHQEYLGDAFPIMSLTEFGPGLVAAFLGADLDNSTGGVWFHNRNIPDISEAHFEYDPNNIWLNRIKDIYAAGIKKWNGNVLMAMPDLGGIMDVVATMRGSENLLYELIDEPEEVKRVSREIQDMWLHFYRDLESVVMPVNPGYSDWSGLYCSTPSYVVQSDFSYMIGPDMFRDFVAEDLRVLCGTLTHSLYHMDGPNELAHLPQLKAMKELDAIQWCPGQALPRCMEWMDIYKQIRAAGKKQHILGNEVDFRAIAAEIGAKGLYHNAGCRAESEREDMIAFLREFGAY